MSQSGMELAQLRTFAAVAETLNFTRAAERIHLTQSAVSHQIKALEEELGEPLFVRSRRGVRLSVAGQAALRHASRVLEETDALTRALTGKGDATPGRVRAAAATQAFAHLFAPLLEDFLRASPHIELSFRSTASTEQTLDDLRDGETDIGFASLPIPAAGLRVTTLFEDELVLVTARRHPLAAQSSATVRQIAAERLIVFERGASIRRLTDDFLKRVRIQPRVALESNDTYFIKLMVRHGLGIALLPSWAVRDEVAGKTLARVAVAGHRLRRSVAVVSRPGLLASPTRAFLDFIVGQRARLQRLAER
jgi:LysR family cyn operon transcriptional activator